MTNPEAMLPPGFRFHPTDEELILHYLRNRATSQPCLVSIIAEVDIYKFDPWDLPAMAKFGDREWYFFSPRDRKYPNGVRPNRAAASGYWKATGTDKAILTSSGKENIGVKKALVFYKGRPPKGIKTNWIMHEYRLAEAVSASSNHRLTKHRDSSMRLDDWVLCRIYKKTNHLPASSVTDHEQEDSNVEDFYRGTLPNSIHQNKLEITTSSSLSDLLDDTDYSVLSRLLYDNSQDMAGLELGTLLGHTGLNQPFMNNSGSNSSGSNFSVPKAPQIESPASVSGNCLKRQRTLARYSEEEGDLLHPSKKNYNGSCTFTSFTNQFDTPQGSLLNQSFFKQQMLLNSHLSLQ